MLRFKNWFEFHNSEKKGILILSFIIVAVISFNLIYPFFIKVHNNTSEVAQKELEHFKSVLDNTPSTQSPTTNKSIPQKALSLFPFDPNMVSESDLKKLGLNHFQRNNLLSYVKAGGQFTSPEDLRKIYGISDSLYFKLLPYIKIKKPKKAPEKIAAPLQQQKSEPVKININIATNLELEKIYGIGPKRASTIIKYRDLLGGYTHPGQFNEIYGLPDSTILLLKEQVLIDTVHLQKITLSSSNYKTLAGHPYLNSYQANAILAFLKAKTNIKSVNQLLTHNVLDTATFKRIKPYLRP